MSASPFASLGGGRRLASIATALALSAASACTSVTAQRAPAQGPGEAAEARPVIEAAALAAAAPRIDPVAANAAYAGARTYAGALSCAGCADQRLTLTIFVDGTFRLRQVDAAAPGAPGRYDIGRWTASPEAPDVIELHGDTEGARLFRRVLPDGLMVIDNEGREIRGIDTATLYRAPRVDPLGGPLRLVGRYRFEGRQPVLDECLTGRRMPVAAGVPAGGSGQAASLMAAAQSALDGAHRAMSAAPEEPVLAIVQGYLVPRVAQPQAPEREALVVVVFERAMRDARCEDLVRRKP